MLSKLFALSAIWVTVGRSDSKDQGLMEPEGLQSSEGVSMIESDRPAHKSTKFSTRKKAAKIRFANAKNVSKHVTRHASKNSPKQSHLVSKDSAEQETTSDADATTIGPTGTESTTTTSTTTSAPVEVSDAYAGTWWTGEFGLCRANCGSGYKYREIRCKDVSGVEIDHTSCDQTGRPSTREACQGDCLSCEVNSSFLKGIGVSASPKSPVKIPLDTSEVLCQVQSTSAVSCCTSSTEAQIQVVFSQLTRGLKAQTQHRDVTVERIGAVYNNVTNVINARIQATADAADRLAAAMDAPVATTSETTMTLSNLREGLNAALDMRTESLQVALSDVAVAQEELLNQLDAMNSLPDDDDVVEGAADGSSSSLTNLLESFSSGIFSADSAGVEESTFSDADVGGEVGSLVEMFLGRSKIHYDSGVSQRVKHDDDRHRHSDHHTSSLLQMEVQTAHTPVNFTDPTLRVYSKQCQTAVETFFVSLSCSACNPLFPILAPEAPENPSVRVPASQCTALYTSCADTLITAHQHMVDGVKALLNSHGNLITVVAQVQPILDLVWSELRFDWLPGFAAAQVAKPDLTKMACVNDLKVFRPFEVTNATDFCNAYLSFASPKAFVKRISVQLDRGVFAMAKFTSCDRCLHDTLMFLADVLGESAHGSLRITLPTRTQAMMSSCGAAMPIRKPKLQVKLPMHAAQMTVEERVSPQVRFASPSESLKALSFYVNVTDDILDQFGDAPPHEWRSRSLLSPENVTREIPVAADTLKQVGPDADMQVHVMNLNCTQHAECYHQEAPSGMRPWWFCAHPNVCTEQPGACTPESKALLESGPKCVRGPCMSDLSAIDKLCPDNAVCPSSGGSSLNAAPSPSFGEEYFARFDLKIRDDDPMMTVVTKGVCACAFDESGAVLDQCEYARCLAYASLIEDKMTCNSELIKQCISIKQTDACAKDDTLDCSNRDLILTYPPDLPNECAVNDFALSSDTRSAIGILPVNVLVLMAAIVVASM